jgi:hypothetical protein
MYSCTKCLSSISLLMQLGNPRICDVVGRQACSEQVVQCREKSKTPNSTLGFYDNSNVMLTTTKIRALIIWTLPSITNFIVSHVKDFRMCAVLLCSLETKV